MAGLTQRVRGVGYNFSASAILIRMGIEPGSSMGYMDEETAKKAPSHLRLVVGGGLSVYKVSDVMVFIRGRGTRLRLSDTSTSCV